MVYPNDKKFALTIVDDTDGDVISNTRPVYEFLQKLGFRTTKTVWVFPPKDQFKGLSLANYRYRQYINHLRRQGFEIALHSVGSGEFSRQDTLDGLETFRQFIGTYPKIQINHAQNPDSIYWGIKRLSFLKPFWRFSRFCGDNPQSQFFWGDYHKKYVKFSRNFVFKGLNTSKIDKLMPYHDSKKPFANHWFSSADGADLKKFLRLTSAKNVDRLAEEGGAAIIYTHFASGFVANGRLNRDFQKNMLYIAKKNGWNIGASELLDYLLSHKKQPNIEIKGLYKLELKWLWQKIIEKIFPIR